MLQGFYSAASGMLMQQRHLNVISNNLANTQTPGYKANRLLSTTFEQTLARLERGNSGVIGTGESTRIVSEVADLWTEGGVTESGRPFDMAITGYGFFNIQNEDGEPYLTRNGQFDLDEEGYLQLRGQGRVLGQGGPIKVDISDIQVLEDGTILNAGTGAEIGKLLITEPTENAEITQQRNGLYLASAVQPVQNPKVEQGVWENSNVNLSDELAAMIMTQRNFSSAAQALQWIDRTYSLAVNIASL